MTSQPTPEQTPERIDEIRAKWEREVDDKLSVYTSTGGTPMEAAIFRNQVRVFFIDEFARLEAERDALTATLAHLTQVRDGALNQLRIMMKDRDEWRASASGYGSDAVEWKILAEQAEATLARVKAQEQCICAAIRLKNGEVWRGHRHDSAILTAQRAPDVDLDGHEQGFITSLNRFVGREEGARIQRAAGIPSAHTLRPVNDLLFSEDLYLRDWRSDAALVDPPVSSSTENP